MRLRWFLSAKVRETSDFLGHVRKLRNAQSDILTPPALLGIDAALQATKAALDANANDETLTQKTAELEKAATKWLKPYPNAGWRENVEVFLVAIVVTMALRAFFLQPFKIPTSSMQPTLFGVTVNPLYDQGFQMPGVLARVFNFAVQGATYHEAIAQDDGAVVRIGPPEHFLRFFNKRTVWVQYKGGGETPITVWFAPDDVPSDPFEHYVGMLAHLGPNYTFHKGDPIFRFVENTGDHLFVDRITYNFRRPSRGEIVVFKTKGTLIPDQNQFYIKRLIGLPGDTISIGTDRHARINGQRLDASTPHFENVYSFDPKIPARPSQFLTNQFYNGHILLDRLDSFLRTPDDKLEVPPAHYAMFGDNTANSLDSRFWRYVPQNNIIGKAWFVYWPITSGPGVPSRFGWYRR